MNRSRLHRARHTRSSDKELLQRRGSGSLENSWPEFTHRSHHLHRKARLVDVCRTPVPSVSFNVGEKGNTDIKSLQLDELRALSKPAYRGDQIAEWLYQKRASAF